MKWYTGSCLLAAIAACFVMGCSPGASRYVGRWVEDGRNAYHSVEFFSDKTASLPTSDLTMNGSWSVLSDGRLKADVSAIGIHYTILGEMKGNQLFLEIDGQKGYYVKK